MPLINAYIELARKDKKSMEKYTRIQVAAFFKRLNEITIKLKINGYEYDFEEVDWQSGTGVITTSFEEPACDSGCCGYETVYEKIPIKYLFDDNWETTLKFDQTVAEARKLAEEKEKKIIATRKAQEKSIREKAQRKQTYLQLQAEFENEVN